MPVVFLPHQSDTQCLPSNRMSAFGFLAFVVQSVNAVVNVANNINSNNNNRHGIYVFIISFPRKINVLFFTPLNFSPSTGTTTTTTTATTR